MQPIEALVSLTETVSEQNLGYLGPECWLLLMTLGMGSCKCFEGLPLDVSSLDPGL